MIKEILDYEKIWRKKEKTKQYSNIKREMYLEFLYQIQIGEDIGVDDRKKFQGIICNEDQKQGTRLSSLLNPRQYRISSVLLIHSLSCELSLVPSAVFCESALLLLKWSPESRLFFKAISVSMFLLCTSVPIRFIYPCLLITALIF
jgi:hypothetical protein